MKQSLVRHNVRFDSRQLARIEELARLERRSVSEIVRVAMDLYLDGHKTASASEQRHLHTSEYVQICLDWIIQQNYPEKREFLMEQATSRMKRHHGA